MKDLSIEQLEKELNERKAELEKKKKEQYEKRAKSSALSREKAKKKFEELAPKIKQYLFSNLKEGNIIECKGYRGVKQVTKVTKDDVLAMCGWMRKGQMYYNGSGSSTSIENVTHILKEGKFVKVLDLMKQENII